MSQSKVALVTGASSGMGQATARLLAQRGFTVFATSRNPSSAEPIDAVAMLPLDVRVDESVAACVDSVVKNAGRLDLLVNNAGYMLQGAVEETSLEEAKAQLETNFWGAVRMVQAVLPAMRAQGSGQIVTISSMAGVIAMPFSAFYSASKFAIEGFSEALRYEVKPFGIRVSVVEPTAFRTGFLEHVQHPSSQMDAYVPWHRSMVAAVSKGMDNMGSDPSLIAALVLRIAEDPAPRLHYQVGKRSLQFYLSSRLMPEGMMEQMMRRQLHLNAPKLPRSRGAAAGGHA